MEKIKKFAKHKLAFVALIIIVVEIILLAVLPSLLSLDPYAIDKKAFEAAPSSLHILGTDSAGRDIFSRIIYGGRNSLLVGILSACISVCIGVPLGLLAGYYRGIFETVIMRMADIFMSFPSMVLILVIVTIIGPSIYTVTAVIGVLGWTSSAKLIYATVLSIRNKEYVESARAAGCSDFIIITKFILPNAVAPLWMSISFRISSAIIQEASLSFLGAGIKAPQASWGNIIQSARSLLVLQNKLWMWVPASICLFVNVVCINMIGEGVRDALDPRMRR
jgi:peptide/nickel transport system permease protein